MIIYDAPGITYDGMPTDTSLLNAVNQISQVWQHLNLNSITPGGFTTDGIASAVTSSLQSTTIPVDAQKMNGADIIGDGSELNPWRGVGVQP